MPDLPLEPEKSEKTAAFLAQETEKIVAEYEKQGIHPYNVPVGGSSLVGAAGYINAMPEIMKQMKERAQPRPSTWSAATVRWVPSAVCWLAPSTSRLPLR